MGKFDKVWEAVGDLPTNPDVLRVQVAVLAGLLLQRGLSPAEVSTVLRGVEEDCAAA